MSSSPILAQAQDLEILHFAQCKLAPRLSIFLYPSVSCCVLCKGGCSTKTAVDPL